MTDRLADFAHLHMPLALTMGDPAGVGGEIGLQAWLRRRSGVPPFFAIDDPVRLARLGHDLGFEVPICTIAHPDEAIDLFADSLPVLASPLDEDPVPGRPSPNNAKAVVASIETAVRLATEGMAAAVVTNPIAKSVLYEAGFRFPGHTEFLADLAGIGTAPVMMLACRALRVVPVTVHVSLRDAIATLTRESIVEQGTITAQALTRDFGLANPRLAVAGLNPHAGEDGSMGHEDQDIVWPAVCSLRAAGIDATGPYPPDTMFTDAARKTYDAAICMYHDQGLIPMKTLGFDEGVNVTLGLPFVRTSPDHGTAFDIAGTGKASPTSLIEALRMAAEMAVARKAHDG